MSRLFLSRNIEDENGRAGWQPRAGIGQGDLADDFSPLRLSIYNDRLGPDQGRVPGTTSVT